MLLRRYYPRCAYGFLGARALPAHCRALWASPGRAPQKACGVPLRCESNSLCSNKYRLRSTMRIATAQAFTQAGRPPVRLAPLRFTSLRPPAQPAWGSRRPFAVRLGSRRPVWVIGAHAVPCGSLGLTPSRVVGLRPRLVAPLGRFSPSGAVAASGGLPPRRSARPPAPRSSSARPPGVRLPRPCPVLGAPSGASFGPLLSPGPSLCVGGLGGRGVPPLFPRPEAPPFSPAFPRWAALLCLVVSSCSGEGARPSPSL